MSERARMSHEASEFEAVIGLEVHAQLATESKIFCSCPAKPPAGTSVGEMPANVYTCPVCTGQPGALPVLNRRAVEFAILAGLATKCSIRERSVFARKNYFYPDLPKGYQISQFDLPICESGEIEIDVDGQSRKIRLKRIHLEEDAGKNIHLQGYSLVNLNRAGVPLIEMVSEPDLRSAKEAGAYLRALHGIVTTIGICDGNMQEGNFRCDANVSIRPRGSSRLGTRVEVKNVNSFRFVEKAIEHEIARQEGLLRAGKKIVQETRGYDSDQDKTYSMRTKEEVQDYRYFPDPDLVTLQVPEAWVNELKSRLPELPEQKRARYAGELGLSEYDAGVLTASPSLSRFFEETLALGASAKPVANFLTGEVSRLLNEEGIEIGQSRLTPRHLSDVVSAVGGGQVSSTAGKQILQQVWRTGDAVQAIIEREGLRQVSDASALEPAIDAVIAAHPAQAAEFRAGKDKLIGFFVGQVMKATGGKANPALLQQLVRKKLSS